MCVHPFGSEGPGFGQQTAEHILHFLTAACFPSVLNSRLCDASILDDLNLLYTHSNYKQCQQENVISHRSHLEKMLSHVLTAPALGPEDDAGVVAKDTSCLDASGLSSDLRAACHKEGFASQLMSGRPAGLSKFPCCQGPDSVLFSKKSEKEGQRPLTGRPRSAGSSLSETKNISSTLSETKNIGSTLSETKNICSTLSETKNIGSTLSEAKSVLDESLVCAKDSVSVGTCLDSVRDAEQTQEVQMPQVLIWENSCAPLGLTLSRTLQESGTIQLVSSTSGLTKDVQVLCSLVLDPDCEGSTCEGLIELSMKKVMLESCLQIIKVLPPGSRLVLLTSTFLTRFTASLLYILSRLFRMTWVHTEPNLWLHQFVILDGFIHAPPEVDHLLKAALVEMEVEDSTRSLLPCVVELVNFQHLLNDRKFVQFVSSYNNCAMAGFINLMLDHYRGRRGEGTEEHMDKGKMESLE